MQPTVILEQYRKNTKLRALLLYWGGADMCARACNHCNNNLKNNNKSDEE